MQRVNLFISYRDRVSWRSSVKKSRQEPTPSNGSAPQSMAASPARRVLGMRTRSFNKTGFDWLIDWMTHTQLRSGWYHQMQISVWWWQFTTSDYTPQHSRGPHQSEWLNLKASLGTVDSEVHIVHISHVITAYTLKSLSSLIYITHNLQATINFKKKGIKKEQQKSEGTH